MKRKIIWLVVSCLMVLSLVLASCAPAAPKKEVTPTAPTIPTAPTAPITPTVPTAPGVEMVKDSLGRMVEKPRYGGVVTWVPYQSLLGFDPAFVMPTRPHTLIQTNQNLMGLDWTKGPTGTGEWAGEFGPTSITHKIGLLAESWEIPDEETIVYHIRKGVHYGLNPGSEASRLVGGRELTAEDVAYAITRQFADLPGSYHRLRWLKEEWPVSVTAPDKYTVVVKANAGYVDSVVLATGEFGGGPYPPEVVKKYGDLRDWKNSVGPGAFMLTDYVPGVVATLVRNPNYWQKDPFHPQNQLPYVDGQKIIYITDPSTRLAALRTGKLDIIYRYIALSRDDAESVRRTNPEMQFKKILQARVWTFQFRMDNPKLPWYDQRVRWALSMAIDREAIARDYYQGDAELLAAPGTPIADYLPAYTPLEQQPQSVQELYKYQPEKAKQLLAEAGYPNGFKIKVDTVPGEDIDLLQVVVFYWEKIGVNLEIKVHETAVFESMMVGRAIMEAGYRSFATSSPYAMHSWIPEDTFSFGQIHDPYNYKVNEVVKKNNVRNEAVAQAALKEFWIYTLEKAWMIHLPAPYQYLPYQPWVKGYSGESMTGYIDYLGATKYLWYDQALKKKLGF